MITTSAAHLDALPELRFRVGTVDADGSRALVRAEGSLDAETVLLLVQALDGHLRAGRRFLRVDAEDVTTATVPAVLALHSVHRSCFEHRGTMVIIAASDELRDRIAQARLDDQLLVASPTAQIRI